MWFSGGIAELWFLQLYQSKVVEGHLVRHLDFNQWWILNKPRTRKVDTGFEGSGSIWPGFVCRQDICTEEGGIGKQPTWAFPQNLLRLQFSSMSRAFQAPFFLYLGWDFCFNYNPCAPENDCLWFVWNCQSYQLTLYNKIPFVLHIW